MGACFVEIRCVGFLSIVGNGRFGVGSDFSFPFLQPWTWLYKWQRFTFWLFLELHFISSSHLVGYYWLSFLCFTCYFMHPYEWPSEKCLMLKFCEVHLLCHALAFYYHRVMSVLINFIKRKDWFCPQFWEAMGIILEFTQFWWGACEWQQWRWTSPSSSLEQEQREWLLPDLFPLRQSFHDSFSDPLVNYPMLQWPKIHRLHIPPLKQHDLLLVLDQMDLYWILCPH